MSLLQVNPYNPKVCMKMCPVQVFVEILNWMTNWQTFINLHVSYMKLIFEKGSFWHLKNKLNSDNSQLLRKDLNAQV